MSKYAPKVHDRGGWPTNEPIKMEPAALMDWELTIDGIVSVLRTRGLILTDELRRSIENIEPEIYSTLKYYERWCTAVENLLIEKQLISSQDIENEIGTYKFNLR